MSGRRHASRMCLVRSSGVMGVAQHFYAFASSGSASVSSLASGAPTPAVLSAGDSALAVSFCAAAQSTVKRPPLKRVLRKNSHVCGQPLVPLTRAISQPEKDLAYSGLNSHEAVLVTR